MRALTFSLLVMALAGVGRQALSQPADASATASPAPIGPSHIVPSWRSKATADDVMRVYPDRALRSRTSGIALIQCSVTEAGEMANCTVEQEAPTGFGFGEAALKLTPSFKMAPTTSQGSPVQGGIVRLPLQFRLPG
jgi:protein TonB